MDICAEIWHISKTPHVFRISYFDLKPALLKKSYTGIDEIVYQYWQFHPYQYKISLISVYYFINTSIQFYQYWYIYNFVNTGFINTCIWFWQYQYSMSKGTFKKIWAGLRTKSKFLKTWRVVEICLDIYFAIQVSL